MKTTTTQAALLEGIEAAMKTSGAARINIWSVDAFSNRRWASLNKLEELGMVKTTRTTTQHSGLVRGAFGRGYRSEPVYSTLVMVEMVEMVEMAR